MARPLAALLLAAAAAAAPAQGPPEPAGRLPPVNPPSAAAPSPPPRDAPGTSVPARPGTAPLRGTVLEEVSGTVREVDRGAHRVTIETRGGPVALSLDRNTMVYGAGGLGTVLDLVPGAQVRAGRNADFLAYWVQVRQPPAKGEAAAPARSSPDPAGANSTRSPSP